MSLKNHLKYRDQKTEKQQLALKLLSIVGIRKINNEYYIVKKDITSKKEEVKGLFLHICLTQTALERKQLYSLKEIKSPEISIAKSILKAAGHSLIHSRYRIPEQGVPMALWKCSSKYILDPNLLPFSTTTPCGKEASSASTSMIPVSIPILCDA